MMAPRRLTFGVEFEFNLATLADDVADPDPQDDRPVRGIRDPYQKREVHEKRNAESYDRRVKKKVAKTLREVGLPTAVPLDPNADKGFELLETSYPWMGGHWVATTDSSVYGPADEYDWWAIEINSPPLIFCDEALDAVLLACNTLTQKFRYNVNESCGLHVHVGNGADNFSVETTRNLVAFLWCFEPLIDTLHPSHRHNGSYCRSIRESSVYGDMHKHQNASVVDILTKIWMEKSKDTLLRLMSDTHSASYMEAYYTGNMQPSAWSGKLNDTKVTVEFRQHEGTLDGPRTVSWVQTVVGLLEFADDCDRFFLAAFLMEHAELEGAGEKLYEIEDLLRDIGLEEPADFYASRPHLS
jgi:hypothetical protein